MDGLDEPLDKIQMSAQLRWALTDAGFRTLRDVDIYMKKKYVDFMARRNVGWKTLNELRCLLKDGALLIPPPAPMLRTWFGWKPPRNNFGWKPPRNKMYVDEPLDEIDMSVRLQQALRQSGCETLRDATRFTDVDFLRIRGFGRKTLNELKELLARDGESLRVPLRGLRMP